jgi:hypothetical protein
VSAGKGAKGHRLYDWAFLRLEAAPGGQPGQHWLMIRRHQRTGELAFDRCYSPGPAPLAFLVPLDHPGHACPHAFLVVAAGTEPCHEDSRMMLQVAVAAPGRPLHPPTHDHR